MIVLYLISTFLTCAFSGFIGLVVFTDNDDNDGILTIGALGIAAILIYIGITISNTPEAMDVYQGKTTLEYTVVDGEKVDSVVVWKQEK